MSSGDTSAHRRGEAESESLQVLIHGIFAITMTLLILDLRVPTDPRDGHLWDAMRALAPQAIAYALGFAWLLTNWLSIRAYFRTFPTIDTTGTVLMLASVAVLSLTPVGVSVVAEAWGKPHDFPVAIRFAAVLVGIAYSLHLIHFGYEVRTGRRSRRHGVWLPAARVLVPVTLSLAASFLSGVVAAVVLALDLFAIALIESLAGRWRSRETGSVSNG